MNRRQIWPLGERVAGVAVITRVRSLPESPGLLVPTQGVLVSTDLALFVERGRPAVQGLFRIVVSGLFACHGAATIFGAFGGAHGRVSARQCPAGGPP